VLALDALHSAEGGGWQMKTCRNGKNLVFVFVLLLLVACGKRSDEPEERLLDFDEVEMTLTADAGSVPTAMPQSESPQSESPPPATTAPTALPQADTPTALPQVATQTPIPPTPTTADAQSAGPTRIRFEPGAISATETGSVAANGTDGYVLYALEGQTMTASVSSPSNEVLLSITGLSDGIPLVRAASDARSWTGKLPGTQDYAINVVSGGPADSYTLFIEILPLGAETDDLDEQTQQNNINRVAFRGALAGLLTATPPDYDTLQTLMNEPFIIAGWGAESQSWTPAEAIEQLRNSYLPPTAQLTYDPDADFGTLLGGASLGDLFPQVGGGDALFLKGWGSDGNGEAIVIVGLDNNGVFTWDAVLIAPSGF
jgi:hypothetical protein